MITIVFIIAGTIHLSSSGLKKCRKKNIKKWALIISDQTYGTGLISISYQSPTQRKLC